jgi:hypothetical protein
MEFLAGEIGADDMGAFDRAEVGVLCLSDAVDTGPSDIYIGRYLAR